MIRVPHEPWIDEFVAAWAPGSTFVAAYVPVSTFVAENSYYDEHGEQPAQIVLPWEHWNGECPD